MTFRLFSLSSVLALALTAPAMAQFANSTGGVPAQNSVCDPNHSSYNAEQCAANPLGATSQGVVHIERSRPEVVPGQPVTTADEPTLQPGQDPLAGGNEP